MKQTGHCRALCTAAHTKAAALPDGSFIFGCDGHEQLRGEAYLLEDGAMRKISREGDVICLSY